MWGMTVTWRMAVEGITKGAQLLRDEEDAGDAIETVTREVEDFPHYRSIGYGGLPNEEMEVGMDAVPMDGDTLDIGAVAVIKDFANPVSIMRRLSHEEASSLLVAEGAEKLTHKEGFKHKNMLIDRTKAYYRRQVKKVVAMEVKLYSGRDTVGMACPDTTGKTTVTASTGGPSMKKKGRVGDSPISGSGFHADSKRGAASVTGLGEDLMKGCTSHEIVRPMGGGMRPQEAYETAVNKLDVELKERRGQVGDLPLIAMNPKGEWGVATNIEGSSFAVVTENQEPTVYPVTRGQDGHCTFETASQEWMEHYMKTRMAPIEE